MRRLEEKNKEYEHLGKMRRELQRKQILIFSGTTEGNQVAEALSRYPVDMYLSVATDYGKVCAGTYDNMEVISGRMDEDEIGMWIQNHKIDVVVDATHPFAREVTSNIKEACMRQQTEYIRCLRSASCFGENAVYVDSVEQAADYLKGTSGKILITTGSKDLKKYTAIPGYQERCYARVLSTKAAVEKSISLGFEGTHLIAMQGPFSVEMNIALLRHMDAAYLVTKESGRAGGFEEKIKAAEETQTVPVVIRRPSEEGMSVERVIARLAQF